MKKLLIALGFTITLLGVYNHANANGYTYYRSVTVTSTTSIASGTNTNFPMLFSGTYTWLEASSTAGGAGRIQNLVTAPNGGQEPADLVFATSSANCGSANLNFETESYVSSTGVISDWINVPSLSAGSAIYACYDNSSVSTDQSHPSSTWNSNYKAVYHLPNGTILNASDSTSFANNAAKNGTTTATTGQIDGAMNTNTNGYLTKTISSTIGTVNTVSEWMNAASFQDSGAGIDESMTVTGGAEILTGTGGSSLNTNSLFGSSFVTGTTFATGTWYYIVNTRNGTNTNGYISYVNGVKDITTTRPSADSGNSLYIGNNSGGGAQFRGTLDEVRIQNAVMTPSWITTEYNNQLSPSTFYAVGNETSFSSAAVSFYPNYALNF